MPQFVIYHHIMSFARNYERKIDKMAENAIFSVYAVPILCTKSRHTMINMLNFHTCLKKYINFPVFWCIFGFAKIKQYAVRLPSSLYIFSKFLSRKEIQLWIKMHLAFRVSTRMQNKRTSAQTGQRPCILH